MAAKEVVVSIARDGEVIIEANNFQGVGCKEATKQLQLVLAGGGSDNSSTRPKPDFYAQNSTGIKVKG